jgi:hypothetical protein
VGVKGSRTTREHEIRERLDELDALESVPRTRASSRRRAGIARERALLIDELNYIIELEGAEQEEDFNN